MLYWSCCESNCYIEDESDDEHGDGRCRSAMKMHEEVKMETKENNEEDDEGDDEVVGMKSSHFCVAYKYDRDIDAVQRERLKGES
ncbi:unnamed protein product [Vicia faba]|uniref:Uncharacterized protein n=1 Tax=Vicia faba TaxID=3906 RepID=A0AAV1A8I9_VICFA|nr:unnamed protein product [Vicia faba]